MATFTSVGDNVTIDISQAADLIISISGTYDMIIAFQKEVGSPGSGVWETLFDFKLPNATISVSYPHPADYREKYRIIVVQDNGGTATATLTVDVAPEVGTDIDWGDIGGTLSDQADLDAALDAKAASDHTHDAATGGAAGFMSAADKTKLDGVETSATADQTDAEIETAYNNQVSVVSQEDAEAGTSTTVFRWTPERVAQAIAALAEGAEATLPVDDTTSLVQDPVDDTKEMRIDVGAVSTSTVRVLTMPDQNVDLTPTTGTFLGSGNDQVTDARLRDSTALSVIGRSANSSGDPADISTTAGSLHVLREASNVIGFGALSTAYITSGAFADARIAESNVTQHVAAIDHDATLNFVADEHIAHSSVSITAGAGLSGGGTIAATRTIALDDTAVTPDTYTLATITVDQQGRITAAENGTGVDETGSLVATSSGVLAVTTASHALHKNVILTSDQASSVFTIAKATAAGVMFAFAVQHDTCTIVVEDNAGSINGVSSATARLINGGFVVARVMSNAGSAPVIAAIGNLIVAPNTVSSTKTYDIDDHGHTFVLDGSAGTQTFSTAVASMFAGYEVMIVNDSGGNITIDGLDTDHTLSDNGFVVVTKMGASLLAVGSDGVTVLDAA